MAITMENKQEIMDYIRGKMRAQVAYFALETEFPAGHYHIKLYETRVLFDFVAALNESEMNRIFREHAGIRIRPLTVAVDTEENRAKTKNPLMFKLVHDLAVCEIYEQDGRIKAEDVERITAEILHGKNNTRVRHRFDVSSIYLGRIECKGMSGLMVADKKDEKTA